MGTVISLDQRRRARERRGASLRRAVFHFDLADPGTYLAAERVERLPAAVAWQPAQAVAPRTAPPDALDRRARELRLPLVWPERHPARLPRAMRVALHAEREGRGVPFVLAATRLLFCGGFDLDDPEVLAEAAAAAGLELDGALAAAGDEALDVPIAHAGRILAARGALTMPVVQVGRALFAGEARLPEAAAALRGGRLARTV